MGRWIVPAVLLAIAVVAVSSAAAHPDQALRTCADRWNQANMRGWGPTLVSVGVRRLLPHEADHVGVYDRRVHCVVSMAVFGPRDPANGCPGERPLRGHPGFCVATGETHICVMTGTGAFWCSHYADGAPPFRNENATTDAHGALRLEAPLPGTHRAPQLRWQRYPHVDGYIEPWADAGTLRRGLAFERRRIRGTCSRGSEVTRARAALRCLSTSMAQWVACFPQATDWNRRGALVACGSAGSTRFTRFVITRRAA